ncbi:histidine kinase [Nonomuraea sp. NPDC046802]|uniref:sensor histidine kinase n=1 Tax=Nonomuraea sp. NPDC046802 TaxID=3154919 RepID=UPI0033F71742
MTWFVRVAAVAIADTTLLWLAGMPDGPLVAYAVLTALAMLASRRVPLVAFLAAVTMAVLDGGSYALLICTGYEAGRRISRRRDAALATVAVIAYLGALLLAAQRSAIAPEPFVVLARVVVLTALPVIGGRYLAQQGERLRLERELSADRERLRIARDMHDSLGHLLSLVSVQAASLEVNDALPQEHRQAVRSLAGTARAAMTELHDVVSTLRAPGLEGIDELVARFGSAGGTVTVERSGPATRFAQAGAGQAAYRVVQEGLTNAARHAPGAPIRVSLDWQPDVLLVAVANPVPEPAGRSSGGSGLAGLSDRVRAAGGLLRVHAEAGEFRLIAMLPVVAGAVEAAA